MRLCEVESSSAIAKWNEDLACLSEKVGTAWALPLLLAIA